MKHKLSTKNKPENFNYITALDGWRAVPILLVIISHGWLDQLVLGGIGVTILFFNSVYVINSLIISELRSLLNKSIGNFYLRRFWCHIDSLRFQV